MSAPDTQTKISEALKQLTHLQRMIPDLKKNLLEVQLAQQTKRSLT